MLRETNLLMQSLNQEELIKMTIECLKTIMLIRDGDEITNIPINTFTDREIIKLLKLNIGFYRAYTLIDENKEVLAIYLFDRDNDLIISKTSINNEIIRNFEKSLRETDSITLGKFNENFKILLMLALDSDFVIIG